MKKGKAKLNPLPDHLCKLVWAAVDWARKSPDLRSRSGWAERGPVGWKFDLLGLLCIQQHLDVLQIPSEQRNEICRGFLGQLGFTVQNVLALQEINDATYSIEILEERIERYLESGRRMPLVDDLAELDRRFEQDESQ
jgi:hypothetical protein